MKLTVSIAKAELRNLFYSPIAWFVTIVFLVQCGYTYFVHLISLTVDQESQISIMGLQGWLKEVSEKVSSSGLTSVLTGPLMPHKAGLIDVAVNNLFLLIPLLTMGIISREMNGTFKLLYSSPVRMRQIVLGKYLSLMIFSLILLGIFSGFSILTIIQVKSADIGLLFSMVLGFYLVVCTYAAIGLFMSSLTSYQIISAIGTFLLLAVLDQVGNYWQRIDFIRDLTYFLSIRNRADKMFVGLIVSRDVFYYVLVIFMFLAFATLKLKGAQEVKPWFVKMGRYFTVLVVVLLSGYISSRPGFTAYWDTTATKVHTISKEVQQLLKDFGDDPVEITLYSNLLDGNAIEKCLPEGRNNYLSEVWDPFLRFKPDLKFKYEYYYNYDAVEDDSTLFKGYKGHSLEQIASIKANSENDIALSWFKSPAEIQKTIDLKSESYRTVIQVKHKENSEFLRIGSNGDWPGQINIVTAFKRLLIAKPPKIYYLTGNLERSIKKKGEREYSSHSSDKGNLSALINLGFDIDSLPINDRDIPADADIVVLADPKTSLSDTSVSRISKYLEKGGNMFFLGEPGKQPMLNPLLQPLGVLLMDGQLVQLNTHEAPDVIVTYPKNIDQLLDNNRNKTTWGMLTKKPIIIINGVSPVTYLDSGTYSKKPFLLNFEGPGNWYKTQVFNIDTVPPVYNPQSGDVRGAFTTLMGLTRKVGGKEQRILVSGDADFISNLREPSTKYQPSYIRGMYAWLNEGQFPMSFVGNKKAEDLFLNNVDTPRAETLKIVFVWVLPGLLLIWGIVFLTRRKRR